MNIQSLNETELVDKKNTHAKTSWIWNYWNEEVHEIQGEQRQVIVCKVIDDIHQTPCGKIYIQSRGSTGNAITHLRNQHDINKNGKINKSDNLEKQDVIVHRRQYSEKKQQEL
ncbi:7290_t:CDS:2, partial [Funneliformis geosporum]